VIGSSRTARPSMSRPGTTPTSTRSLPITRSSTTTRRRARRRNWLRPRSSGTLWPPAFLCLIIPTSWHVCSYIICTYGTRYLTLRGRGSHPTAQPSLPKHFPSLYSLVFIFRLPRKQAASLRPPTVYNPASRDFRAHALRNRHPTADRPSAQRTPAWRVRRGKQQTAYLTPRSKQRHVRRTPIILLQCILCGRTVQNPHLHWPIQPPHSSLPHYRRTKVLVN
jgi:hypothetical protein